MVSWEPGMARYDAWWKPNDRTKDPQRGGLLLARLRQGAYI